MDDEEQGSFRQELGRMPEGHFPMYGGMPKPDAERAADFTWQRLLVPFVLALLVGAAIFLVLPGFWSY